MSDIKKATADSKIYDVIQREDYNPTRQVFMHTAVEHGEYIYPIRGKTDTKPGIYDLGFCTLYKSPESDEDKAEYSTDKLINLSTGGLRDLVEKGKILKDIEKEILIASSDSITIAKVSPDDMPEMVALKNAINDKRTNIDLYAARWPSKNSFNNDKRILTTDKITLDKLKVFAKNLDMKITMIIEDASTDIANPIGNPIEIVIVEGDK